MASENRDPDEFDVIIIGAGSASESLVRELAGHGRRVAVIEAERVGGECPFTACMPSKAMLHDADIGTVWSEATRQRDNVVKHLDDAAHAAGLEQSGAELVRGRARVDGPHTVRVGDRTMKTEHLVLATGSEAVVPPIDGLEGLHELLWTSAAALTTHVRPDRLLIVGGGVIGMELAQIYAGFTTRVSLVDEGPRAFPSLVPAVGELVDAALTNAGVAIRRGVELGSARRQGDEVVAEFSDGSTTVHDQVLVAVGKRPRTRDLGLESIGLDPNGPLPVGNDARIDCEGSVWAIGDVAGKGEYTHVANHHGVVLANQLVGDANRRFDDVVTPSCVFTAPPVMVVGPTMEELDSDHDVVWFTQRFDDLPRTTTDRLPPGVIAVAARRSSGAVIAAHGVGPRVDELAAAFVVAIDGRVPLRVLRRSMMPFPTVSEVLPAAFKGLADRLETDAGLASHQSVE